MEIMGFDLQASGKLHECVTDGLAGVMLELGSMLLRLGAACGVLLAAGKNGCCKSQAEAHSFYLNMLNSTDQT